MLHVPPIRVASSGPEARTLIMKLVAKGLLKVMQTVEFMFSETLRSFTKSIVKSEH